MTISSLNSSKVHERVQALTRKRKTPKQDPEKLSNTVPLVTLALSGTHLSPLFKYSTGIDRRLALPQDRDFCTWCQGAQRQYTDATREQVTPQQIAVGVSGGVEVVSRRIEEPHDEAERLNIPLIIVA